MSESGNVVFSTFGQTMVLLHQVSAKYKDKVVRDPDFTSKLESGLKLASYLIPGGYYLE